MSAHFKIPSRKNPIFKTVGEFEKIRTLGNGAFATVFEVVHTPTFKKFALKQVNLAKIAPVDFENVFKELEIHSRLASPFLVKMFDFWKEGTCVYIVVELCPNGNLYRYMNTRSLTEGETRRFFVQAVLGIKYLHSQGVIMRDLKPENIVLDASNNAKLCDFGWAAELSDVAYCSIKAGTYAYMSPESLGGTLQAEKSDIWSLGILLYELCFNREPYSGRSCAEMLKSIRFSELNLVGRSDESAKSLIQEILKVEVTERPGMKEILSSQFFQESLRVIDPAVFKRPVVSSPISKPLILESHSSEGGLGRSQLASPTPNVTIRHNTPIIKPSAMNIYKTEQAGSTSARPLTNPLMTSFQSVKALEKMERLKTEPKKLDSSLFKPLFSQTVANLTSPTPPTPVPKSPNVMESQKLLPPLAQSSRVASADPKHLFASHRPNIFPLPTLSNKETKPVFTTPNVASKSPLFNPLYKDTATIKRTHSETNFLTPVMNKVAVPVIRYNPPPTQEAFSAPSDGRKARRIDQTSHCSFVNDPATERNTSQVSHSPSITFLRQFSSHMAVHSSLSQPPPIAPSTQSSLLNLATTKALPRGNVVINHSEKRLNSSISENAKPTLNRPNPLSARPIVVVSSRTPGGHMGAEKSIDHNIYAKTKIGIPLAGHHSSRTLKPTLHHSHPTEEHTTNIYQRTHKIVVISKPELRKPDLKLSFGGTMNLNRRIK
jgi:serine/threonine protein kinase